MSISKTIQVACVAVVISVYARLASAEVTAFTYQGQLQDGGHAANGAYDLTFALFPVVSGGSYVPGTTAVTNLAVPVTNGLFTVTVDFGAAPFNGAALWIEIAARTNGNGPFATLAPRQPLTAAPYSIMAGGVAGNGLSAGAYSNALTLSNPENVFSGNGSGLVNVPGALPWQNPSGASIQAAPNTGYVITNTSQPVTLTLPAAPNIGDIIGISCPGFGWQLDQNPGQMVLGQSLVGSLTPWIQDLPSAAASQGITCLISSPDGNHLVATGTAALNFVFISADAGAHWTNFVFANCVACQSADGNLLTLATAEEGGIYQATNASAAFQSANFGTNFTKILNTNLNFAGITCSSDGSHLAACADTGGIYISSDFGAHWAPSDAPVTNWTGIASSADGSHLAACFNVNGRIYTSLNYGTNWTLSAGSPVAPWVGVASSSDGSHLVAGTSGIIYTSPDFGADWTRTSAPGLVWYSVASSADGTRLAAGSGNALANSIYLSSDAGQTWSLANTPVLPSPLWGAMASSASGAFVAADTAKGGVYSLKTATTAGSSGFLTGGSATAVQLQYAGNGQFLPINHEGTLLLH